MKRLAALGALALALFYAGASSAQQTRAALNNYNNTFITQNGRGAITGPVLNSLLNLMINSTGILGDTNVWTGVNSFPAATNLGNSTFYAQGYGSCAWTSVGDVGPCINLAIAAAATQGGGTVVIPAGTFGVATPIVQNKSGVKLMGQGHGIARDTIVVATYQAVTHLLWNGAAGATMFNVEPSPNTGSVQSLFAVDVWGIVFDCNSIANIGFRAAAVVSSQFNVAGAECRSINVLFTTDNITDTPGTQDNDIWAYSRSTNISFSPTGIMFDSCAFNCQWNFSFNRVHKAFAWYANGDGIVWGDSDNNLIDDMSAFRNPTGTGNPIVFANHAYISPNGVMSNGHSYSDNFRHMSSPGIVAGFQSGSTFVSTSGTNACNGGGNAGCGPGSVTLTTNGTTNQLNKNLNFASTTGVVAGEAVVCGGSSLGGILPGEITAAVAPTAVGMNDGAASGVANGASCAFTYGVTSSAASGVYTLVSTGGNTFTLTAPAGGHTQSGISVSSGTLTFTDVVLPWTGTATTADSWTLTVPSSNPVDLVFNATDNANSVVNPRFEYGTAGAYARTNVPYWVPVGPTGYGNVGVVIGNGTAGGVGAISMGGGASVASGANSFATGPGVNVSGNAAAAFNHGNAVSAQYGFAINDTNTVTGNDGFAYGFSANDHGAILAGTHGCVKFSTNGDCQAQEFLLRGTGSSTAAIRLTSDGGAPSFFNCGNVQTNSGYSLVVTIMAFDHTTPTKNETWQNWNMLLTAQVGPGTAALVAASTPTPLTNGSLAGSAISVTADTTNGCPNISFTPPSGNTDTWNVNARVEALEVQ